MWLQKLKVLHKNPLPGGKQAEVASMALAPYCAFTHGPGLLLSTSDSFLTVYRIQDSVSLSHANSLLQSISVSEACLLRQAIISQD